jgi:hypothetical protein
MPISSEDLGRYAGGELEIISLAGFGRVLRGSIRHIEYEDGVLGAMLLWQAQSERLQPTGWRLKGLWVFHQCTLRMYRMTRERDSIRLDAVADRTVVTLRARGSKQLLAPSRVAGLDLDAALAAAPDIFGWPLTGKHLYTRG